MNQIQRLNVLKKHAKNFVAGPKSGRPLFTGIHYAKNGVAAVTNTHYVLRAEDVHSYVEPITLHHKTDDVIEGAFPNLEAVWPTKHIAEICIPTEAALNDWANYHAVAEMVTKDSGGIVRMKFTGAETVVTCSNEVAQYTGKLPGVINREPFKVSYSPVYMKNMLNAILDFKPDVVTLKISGGLSPLVLTTNVGVSTLMLPIRDNF